MLSLLTILFPLTLGLVIDILSCNETSQTLIFSMTSLLQKSFDNMIEINHSFLSYNSSNLADFIHPPSIVIDLTFSPFLRQIIIKEASILKFIHIRPWQLDTTLSEWEFDPHVFINDHINAYLRFTEKLNITSLLVTYQNFWKFPSATLDFTGKSLFYSISNDLVQGQIDNLIGRELKLTGMSNYLILNNGDGAIKIIESLKKKKLYSEGASVIINSEGIWGAKEDGLIIITENELELSEDSDSYESLAVRKMIAIILQSSNLESSFSIKEKLVSCTVNHYFPPSFSIVNIRNGRKIIIGSIINGTVDFSIEPIFPGNTKIYPEGKGKPIPLSIASGSSNYNNEVLNFNSELKKSAKYAIDYANEFSLIGNFKFSLFDTDCGAEIYDHDFSYNCFSKIKDKLGVAFIASTFDPVCIGTIHDFMKMNITIPIISNYCTSPALTNSTIFPEFLRIPKSVTYHSQAIVYLIKHYGWNNVIVLYENTTLGIGMYHEFIIASNSHGISIVNDEDKRMVKSQYQKDDFEDYKTFFIEAINTKVTIIVLMMDTPYLYYAVENFYDVGLRRGDAIFIFYTVISYSIVMEDEPYKHKLEELLYGSLAMLQSEFIGNFGKTVQDQLSKFLNKPSNYLTGACFPYDASNLILNGINFLLNKGEDFTDPQLLNHSLRKQKFIGCSGKISMSTEINERSDAIINIFNVIYNESNDVYYEFPIATYQLTRNPPFIVHNKTIWPNGEEVTPSDHILNPNNCHFNLHLIENSVSGSLLFYMIALLMVLITFISAILMLKKYWYVKLEQLEEKREIKFNDYVVIFMLVIDFFQFIAIGPDIGGYDKFTSIINTYAYADLSSLFNFTRNYFWIAIYITSGLTFFFFICGASIYFEFNVDYKNFFTYNLGKLAEICLPIYGNIAFLPIISVLLNVFQCEKGISSKITDSFLNKDCTVFCWTGFHLAFSILTMVILILYIQTAIYSDQNDKT